MNRIIEIFIDNTTNNFISNLYKILEIVYYMYVIHILFIFSLFMKLPKKYIDILQKIIKFIEK